MFNLMEFNNLFTANRKLRRQKERLCKEAGAAGLAVADDLSDCGELLGVVNGTSVNTSAPSGADSHQTSTAATTTRWHDLSETVFDLYNKSISHLETNSTLPWCDDAALWSNATDWNTTWCVEQDHYCCQA
jgi:hypothetical protein